MPSFVFLLYAWAWSLAHAASVGQKQLVDPRLPTTDGRGLESVHGGRKLQGRFLHFTGNPAAA